MFGYVLSQLFCLLSASEIDAAPQVKVGSNLEVPAYGEF
jgi:hypothetical protein